MEPRIPLIHLWGMSIADCVEVDPFAFVIKSDEQTFAQAHQFKCLCRIERRRFFIEEAEHILHQTAEEIRAEIARAQADMERAAKSLDFLAAARFRDRIQELEKLLH